MRPLSILILMFALTLAGVVFFVVPALMPSAPAPVAQPREPGGDVLVAARNLPAGTLLKAGDVRWQRWPEDGLDANLLVKEKGASINTDIVGRVVLRGFVFGEPVASSRLLKSGDAGFLAAALAPGMRAASVRIDAVSGNGGFIVPGDSVDVLLGERFPITYSGNDAGFSGTRPVQRFVNSVILNDVRVLAIDQDVHDMDNKPKVGSTATLEVDLAQAQKLSLAAQMGVLSLTLRSFARAEDASETPTRIVYDADVSPYFDGMLGRQLRSGVRVYHGAAMAGQGQ